MLRDKGCGAKANHGTRYSADAWEKMLEEIGLSLKKTRQHVKVAKRRDALVEAVEYYSPLTS